MFPELLRFGRISLPTYGLMAAIGLLAGLGINVRNARRHGLDPDKAWNLGILAILSAIVGAKLLLLVTDWRFYLAHPDEVFSLATLQAGGVFYGGLLAALGMSYWYIRRSHLPLLTTCDLFAPGVAFGHALGRLGCFAAGCCYGRPTELPWGVIFTHPLAGVVSGTPLRIPLHPTQLYEMLVELANFSILMLLLRYRRFQGQVIGAYLFLYGFARYFLEFLRGDPGRGSVFGGLMTATQLISTVMVVAGGLLWMRRRPIPAAVSAH